MTRIAQRSRRPVKARAPLTHKYPDIFLIVGAGSEVRERIERKGLTYRLICGRLWPQNKSCIRATYRIIGAK